MELVQQTVFCDVSTLKEAGWGNIQAKHPSQGLQEKVRNSFEYFCNLRMPRSIAVRKGVNVLARGIFHLKFSSININFHFLF